MQMFIVLMSVAVVLFILIVWASLRDQRTAIRGPALTQEQERCAGIWEAVSPQGDFYLALEQVNQRVQGTYRAGATKIDFSATYSAPRLFFDIIEIDKSISVVTAAMSKDGSVLTGKHWNPNAQLCKQWTAHRVLPLEHMEQGERIDVAKLAKLNGLLETIILLNAEKDDA